MAKMEKTIIVIYKYLNRAQQQCIIQMTLIKNNVQKRISIQECHFIKTKKPGFVVSVLHM